MINRKAKYRIPLDHPELDDLHRRMYELLECDQVDSDRGRIHKEFDRIEQMDPFVMRWTKSGPLPAPNGQFKPFHSFDAATVGAQLQERSNYVAYIRSYVERLEAKFFGPEDDI